MAIFLGEVRLRAGPIPARLTLGEAVEAAHMEADRRGWHLSPSAVFALPRYGVYSVRLLPPGDDGETGLGPTRLFTDDQDGHIVAADIPGVGTPGDVFIQLQFPLHSGAIVGICGRIAVSVTGLVIAMLSVTGVLIWWQKHRPRARS